MKKHAYKIRIKDFDYPLPEKSIAMFPREERDKSRLLVYNNNEISQNIFRNINKYLPESSMLLFNNSKVFHARMIFRKASGAEIEIFCLNPVYPSKDYRSIMQQKGSCQWDCLVGNLRRWKGETLEKKIKSEGQEIVLKAIKIAHREDAITIEFSWIPGEIMFSEIIKEGGLMPLPPYIKRAAKESDKKSYQTVYAEITGSVAAPTAGLHFTNEILDKIKLQGIKSEFVTLHVGSGTFLPVNSESIDEHKMHREYIEISLNTIRNIISHISQRREYKAQRIIAVGTTTARTLESLYLLGVKLLISNYELRKGQFEIKQWEPYESEHNDISALDSLKELEAFMKKEGMKSIAGSTELIIIPGYKFRIIDGLISNFHQPKSTLLLLVSAFIGDDWKKVYEYALKNDFRFLSYGDACLFLKC